MKYCTSCGKELNDRAKFCTGCGAKCEINVATNIHTPIETEPISQEKLHHTSVNKGHVSQPESTTKQRKNPKGAVAILAIILLAAVVVCTAGALVFQSVSSNKDSTYYVRSVGKFSEGLSWVATYTKTLTGSSGTQYACIDTEGTVQLMLEEGSSEPTPFANGVSCYMDASGIYTVINKNGNVVFSSADGSYDGIIMNSEGCHAVYTYTENFNTAGYKVFFINEKGKVTSEIKNLSDEIPELINCGGGVFAQKISQNAAAEVTYRFYDAQSGNQYELGEIGYHTDISYIFHNGYAVIEGPRMGDIPRLVSTSGKITELNSFGYGFFYNFGPVSDGGVVCTSYYQDEVEAVYFYNIETGKVTQLGNYGERVDLNRSEGLHYDCGHLLLPLIGADGKKYYTILDKSGRSLFDPVPCESAYSINGDRIGVWYTSGTAILDGNGKVIVENVKGPTSLSYNDGWSVYDNSTNYIDTQGNLMFENGKLVTN